MCFSPGDRVFVDESKARGYIIAATAASLSSQRVAEKALRSLLKPGQRRIHFKSERDSRRREILSRMHELDLRVTVWIAKGLPDKQARPLCLTELTTALIESGVDHLFIERDESLITADKRIIAGILRGHQPQTLRYTHVVPTEQPLLWVSDAVAWCYASGGDWIRRATPLTQQRVFRL